MDKLSNAFIVFIALVVAIAVCFSFPQLKTKPVGIFLPLQSDKATSISPGDVKVIRDGGTLFQGTVLGTLHFQYHPISSSSEFYDLELLINEARTLAAEHGVGVLLITNIGHTFAGTPGAMKKYVLEATGYQ